MVSMKSFVIVVVVFVGFSCHLTDTTRIDPSEDDGKVPAKRDLRIRKEFTAMTFEERKRFVRAYKFVSRYQPYRRRFEHLVGLHQTLFRKVHVEKQFFPWHRWYLLQFENLLRRVEPRLTLPYWDWSLRSQKLWETGTRSVWNNHPWGLGGNGTGMFSCVNSGPFSKKSWRLAPRSGGGCLRRNFMGRMPGVVAIHITLRFTVKDFKKFEEMVRKFYHNELHCCIQGTMELKSASNTPEFLLHHTFMDKLWYDWQGKGPEYRMKLDDNMDSKLRGAGYVVRKFMDPDNLGAFGTAVHYKDPFPGYKRLHATLKSLDINSLTMMDSYIGRSSTSCCPSTPEARTKKSDEIVKSMKDIPLEVALDYGE